MNNVIMGCAAVSIDGSIASKSDEIGPLFDWMGSGEVAQGDRVRHLIFEIFRPSA